MRRNVHEWQRRLIPDGMAPVVKAWDARNQLIYPHGLVCPWNDTQNTLLWWHTCKNQQCQETHYLGQVTQTESVFEWLSNSALTSAQFIAWPTYCNFFQEIVMTTPGCQKSYRSCGDASADKKNPHLLHSIFAGLFLSHQHRMLFQTT